MTAPIKPFTHQGMMEMQLVLRTLEWRAHEAVHAIECIRHRVIDPRYEPNSGFLKMIEEGFIEAQRAVDSLKRFGFDDLESFDLGDPKKVGR